MDSVFYMGDFNIPLNKMTKGSKDFKDLLEEFNMHQVVEGPTQESGNTLDLVLQKRNKRFQIEKVNGILSLRWIGK